MFVNVFFGEERCIVFVHIFFGCVKIRIYIYDISHGGGGGGGYDNASERNLCRVMRSKTGFNVHFIACETASSES
jgi:hypothetical protein